MKNIRWKNGNVFEVNSLALICIVIALPVHYLLGVKPVFP
jgi:hypothetical protein